jgi:2-octaprenyl-6-methoxyphenol hydroxylase
LDSSLKNFDIVIVGSGMIGTSLALALAPLNLNIAIVESIKAENSKHPSFDDRSTALSRSTQRMLMAMDLWNEIIIASSPIKHIHVSDKGRFGFSHIDAKEEGVEALGYVVINRVLGEILNSSLLSKKNVSVFCPAKVHDIEFDNNRVTTKVTSENDEFTLSSKLIVAADGANSSVREMMGIKVVKHDYAQRAVIGNLVTEKPLLNRAFERFTSQGPLAILPLVGDRAGFIWTVNENDASRISSLDDNSFLDEIQEEFGYRLGKFSRLGTRTNYPLVLSKASQLTVSRGVLIGNAAHGLHPVSGQGFNLGMRDVAALSECIADNLSRSSDPGDREILDRYSSWRRADQKKLVYFTDNLVRLFGSLRTDIKVLRNIGMIGFDLIPGVRSIFAKHTMGLAGELPRLSRGVPLR